jgi:hypothetical protein
MGNNVGELFVIEMLQLFWGVFEWSLVAWSNYVITMVGVMYRAPKVLKYYSCEYFATTQWLCCQLILYLVKKLVVKLTGRDQCGESYVLGTQSAWKLFLIKFWHLVVVLMAIDFIFDEFFGGMK